MRLTSIEINQKNPFVENYFKNFAAVEEYYAYNPYRREDFLRRYRYLQDKRSGANSAEVADILEQYNTELGCGQAALANLQRLREGAPCVLTGQQAGIMTGPLYTIYKIITAIQLAANMSGELGTPVIPLFWVASEDHDYQEINQLELVTKENRLAKLKLEWEPEGKFSIGDLPVNEAVAVLIEELAANTIDTEFKEEVLGLARAAAGHANSLADWFARLINKLFDNYGLVMVNPMLPGLRGLARNIFIEFLGKTTEINEALIDTSDRLKAAGYNPQIEIGENQTNLFMYFGEGHGERLPLLWDGEQYTTRGVEKAWSREEILDLMEREPASFSPNVVLRPVTQDYLFPTLAYIGGPGEIAYYGQYREIYPLFGMEMPIIYPRINITLVERYLDGYAQKYNLSYEEILTGGLKAREELFLAEADKIDLDGLFTGMRDELRSLYGRIMPQLASLDDNLKTICFENEKRIMHQVEQLEGKARQYHRKKSSDSLRQFEKIGLNLVPEGSWQERKFNIFPYLIKYGPDLIGKIAALDLIKDSKHKLIFVE